MRAAGASSGGAASARAGPARDILNRLADVGLGYLGLGLPLTTLSGGERQRLKLAIHMANSVTTYVLDEPTTGMHLADGIIDLGPGAGHDGGQVVFTGTPADLVAHGDSLTAQHLRIYLDAPGGRTA
jgi:excinuclease UvrABC ATPase subunit